MPSWARKIPDAQIWEIAAYVKSLSGPSAAEGPGQTMPSPAARRRKLRRRDEIRGARGAGAATMRRRLGAARASSCWPCPRLPCTGVSLRVCADPNNLPFSNDRGEGFENKIAELIAAELGAELKYTWWAQRRGFVRNTLKAGDCDLWPGVISGFELLATSRPYYRSTYVFVTREDRDLDIASFDDPRLRQLTIGVQMIGNDAMNTPPAHALARRGSSRTCAASCFMATTVALTLRRQSSMRWRTGNRRCRCRLGSAGRLFRRPGYAQVATHAGFTVDGRSAMADGVRYCHGIPPR